MRQHLVTNKGVVIIDIGRLTSSGISRWEINTHRESSFRASSPMEASTSGSRKIRQIMALVATILWKQQQNSRSSMSRSYFSMHVGA